MRSFKRLYVLASSLLLSALSGCHQGTARRVTSPVPNTTAVYASENSAPTFTSISPNVSKAARTYAWKRFACFRQVAELDFPNWLPRCTLMSPSCEGPINPGPAPDINFNAIIAHLPEQPTDIVHTGAVTLYDPISIQHVQHLCLVKSMQRQKQCTSSVPFPDGKGGTAQATIIRTTWAVVPAGAPSASINLYNSGVRFLPSTPSSTLAHPYPSSPLDTVSKTCPARLTPGDSVPLVCFHSVQVTAQSAAVPYALDSQPNAGDRLILLGVHIIRREIGGWKFTTFWWQTDIQNANNACNPTEVGNNICPDASSKWSHYAMSTVELPSSGLINAVFNPYFEADIQNNSRTNCQVCHDFAAFPQTPPSRIVITDTHHGAGHVTVEEHNKQLSDFLRVSKGRIQADQLWSMSDALTAGP